MLTNIRSDIDKSNYFAGDPGIGMSAGTANAKPREKSAKVCRTLGFPGASGIEEFFVANLKGYHGLVNADHAHIQQADASVEESALYDQHIKRPR